jgi:hypothetical protein
MSTTQSPLRIAYTGDPIAVDPERITEEMFVPNLGLDGDLRADDQPGAGAVSLFRQAEGEGALSIPDCLTVDCYARDDLHFGAFMLVAQPAGEPCTGVTRGWCDAETIARSRGDERKDNDPAVVREALELMAAEINAALSGQ